ncbi:hypothetical protein J8I87_01070 [Paraburkholderia sp. LEh10]|uniref:hypothetical protein n=1 Tax=Paraburkholderia sp. LEh10 TaxID=2821353 RepID=UPI001AE7311C|nr:hypothetical protein [Paraburkholderia sp. LEh10]MBP0588334.1 hypothetical protein [Paraburkholderia sp. LEh10]
MNIIDMARASGLTVILDGRIGREEYQSVCGSMSALQRFAEALSQSAVNQSDGTPRPSAAASQPGRRRWRRSAHVGSTDTMSAPARHSSRNTHRNPK